MCWPATPMTTISISWGAAEGMWSSNALSAYNQLFGVAVSKGVTVFAASGDDGSRDNNVLDVGKKS